MVKCGQWMWLVRGCVRLCIGLLVGVISSGVMAAPKDFDEAKRLAERVYADHPEEFYCGCRITWRNSGKDLVDWGSCGYRARKDPVRAQRIEWEHVVPASWFGQPMACWKAGGRQNCSKKDPVFQRMEADLHNLTPSVGEVNGDRGNMPFGRVAADKGQYGQCATRVDRVTDHVEPRDHVKGDVARIAFYMADRYRVKLDAQQLQVLVLWAQQDPVDKWEVKRDERIGQHMGWRNPYVAKASTIALPVVSDADVAKSSATEKAGTLGKKVAVSSAGGRVATDAAAPKAALTTSVRGNRNSKLFHFSHCPGYPMIKPDNRVEFANAEAARASGYRLAGNCR